MSELIDKYQEPNDTVRPINEFEKDMLKNTFNAEQLLEQEKQVKQLSEDQQAYIKKRNYMTKVKVIANNMLGKPPIANPSFYNKKDKAKMIEYMDYVINNYTEDDLTKEFNEICTDKLFDEDTDYSTLPVYNYNFNSTPLYDI
jgi:hypothetical protein